MTPGGAGAMLDVMNRVGGLAVLAGRAPRRIAGVLVRDSVRRVLYRGDGLCVDCAKKPAVFAEAYRKQREIGFVPYVGERELNRLIVEKR